MRMSNAVIMKFLDVHTSISLQEFAISHWNIIQKFLFDIKDCRLKVNNSEKSHGFSDKIWNFEKILQKTHTNIYDWKIPL